MCSRGIERTDSCDIYRWNRVGAENKQLKCVMKCDIMILEKREEKTMDNKLFMELQNRFSPIISNLINLNGKFYHFRKTIRWQFSYNEQVAVIAWCDSKTNFLTVNVCSVEFAFQIGQPLMIEYFLLHEIRHLFQFNEISDYETNPDLCVDKNLAKKWSGENKKYVGALKENGEVNQSYYNQDMEFDAFAFSFAVMKYKYGEIPYIERPKAYGKKFDDIVEKWCEAFQSEGL